MFTNIKISLSELVEPLDYEEFLIQHSNLLNRDPLRTMLDFPVDDVQVKIIPRKIRTTEYIVPKENVYVIIIFRYVILLYIKVYVFFFTYPN